MKTWTNPSVEELDVKLTAALYAWWQVEESNGVLDDSLLWGTDPGTGNGNGNGTGDENGNGDGSGNGSGSGEPGSGFGGQS